jgi:hypothetical protein
MCRPFHHPLIITCENILRMFERMIHSKASNRSVVAAGIASALLAYGSVFAQAPQANPIPGYTILVRGYYTGDGTASTNGGFVSLSATVRDPSGNIGLLSATSIDLVGDHFSGPATAFGKPITVSGRVDAADPTTGAAAADAVVTDGRIGALYIDPRGHTGRIVGTKIKPPPPPPPPTTTP